MKTSIQDEFKNFLRQEDRLLPKLLAKIEKATSANREHVAYGLISMFSLYMIFGQRAQLIASAVGVVYPALMSFKAVQTADARLSAQWLAYWSVFGAFSLVDALIGTWPMYWLAKCVALLTLYLPWFRFADRIYCVAVPAFSRLVPLIESVQRETKFEQTKEEVKPRPADASPPAEPRD